MESWLIEEPPFVRPSTTCSTPSCTRIRSTRESASCWRSWPVSSMALPFPSDQSTSSLSRRLWFLCTRWSSWRPTTSSWCTAWLCTPPKRLSWVLPYAFVADCHFVDYQGTLEVLALRQQHQGEPVLAGDRGDLWPHQVREHCRVSWASVPPSPKVHSFGPLPGISVSLCDWCVDCWKNLVLME